MDSWQERLRFRLDAWPLTDRLLTAAAAVLVVGLVLYGLAGRDDGRSPGLAAVATSTTSVLGAAGTTSTTEAATTTIATTTSAVPETTVPVTGPPTTSPPATSPPTTAPPATTPPTTARPPVTSPPPTQQRFGRFCGFLPGSSVEVDLNGRTVDRQTADADGCITVTR